MIEAGLFLCGVVLFTWMGWRCSGPWVGTGSSSGPDRASIEHLVVRVVGAYVVGCGLIVIVMAGLGGFGFDGLSLSIFTLPSLVVCMVGLAVVVSLATKARARERGSGSKVSPPVPASPPAGLYWKSIAGLVLSTLILTSTDFVLSFALAPIEWDAMTYHLYLPARWIQGADIAHVPTVFGDNSAAFAPQNGALLFAWSMMLLGSDAATNAMQCSGLVVIGLGTFYLARCLGVGRAGAALTGCLPYFVEPLREQVFSADVDAWMISFHVSALVILAVYVRSGRPAALWFAGVAIGLVLGTKTIGLTLGSILFVGALVMAARRRHLPHLFGCLVLALATGGFWYLRNLVSYGNPIFPLDFGLGPLRFEGAYGMAEVRAGEFHLDSAVAVARNLVGSIGWLEVALLGMATWALARAGLGHGARSDEARVAQLLLAVGVTWALWFVIGVPHNSQVRLALPAVTSLLPAVGLAFRRWPQSSGRLGVSAVVVIVVGVLWSAHPITRWIDGFGMLRTVETSIPRLTALSIFALSAWAALAHAGLRRRSRPRRAVLLAGALIASVLFIHVATETNEDSRLARFASSDFAGWAEYVGYLHESDAAPATVAYSGANLPYVLVGRRLRNRVVYVNTVGDLDDGFYDHWVRGGRQRFGTYKPGLYRDPEGGPEAWTDHLQEWEPEWLHLFSLHPFERAYLRATVGGFPVESEWARAQPEHFEEISVGANAEVFRVR